MLLYVLPLSSLEFLLGEPQLAFTNPDMVQLLSSKIYEAKKEELRDAVPRGARYIADTIVSKQL